MACENTQNHTPAEAEFYNLQPAFCFVMRGLWGSVWNTGREELNFESPPRTKVFRKQNITMVSELLCQKAGAPRIGFPKPGVSLQDELPRQRHHPASECQGFTGSKQLPTLVLLVRNERDVGFPAMPFLLCSASLLILKT